MQTTVGPCGVVAGGYGERGNMARSSLGSQDRWGGRSDTREGEEQPKETYCICQGWGQGPDEWREEMGPKGEAVGGGPCGVADSPAHLGFQSILYPHPQDIFLSTLP